MDGEQLRRSILENRFVERIRHRVIDEDEYAKLVEALTKLATLWSDAKLIDKRLAAELHVISVVTRGIGEGLEARHPERARRVYELWAVLEDLVLKCYSTERPYPPFKPDGIVDVEEQP